MIYKKFIRNGNRNRNRNRNRNGNRNGNRNRNGNTNINPNKINNIIIKFNKKKNRNNKRKMINNRILNLPNKKRFINKDKMDIRFDLKAVHHKILCERLEQEVINAVPNIINNISEDLIEMAEQQEEVLKQDLKMRDRLNLT